MVQKSFDGLEAINSDLNTGGIELPSLDYDSALSLTRLVSDECDGRPIVLILDAWEKSPTIQKVFSTLESFIDHSDEWPICHMLIGIRNPELHCSEENRRSYEFVGDLNNMSALVDLKRLSPMQLNKLSEKNRMLEHLRTIAPAAAQIDDEEVLKIVDGFPGVLKRFRDLSNELNISEDSSLYEIAEDAQNYRYREFDKLLPPLQGDELKMAIRIALFYRLNELWWLFFRGVLCEGLNPNVWEELIQSGVFEKHSYPKYGHDTRHEFALRRFINLRPDTTKQELERVVFGLAERVQYVDERDMHFIEALGGLLGQVIQCGLSEFAQAICIAANEILQVQVIFSMEWLDRALEQISENCPKAATLFAAVLFNRSLLMSQSGYSEGAIDGYTAVIEMKDISAHQRARALNNRGVRKNHTGDSKGAIDDYTAVIEMENVSANQRAPAFINRGNSKVQTDDSDGAIDDFTVVIEMENASADHRAQALLDRGDIKGQDGDSDGAIDDYTAVIEMESILVDHRARALNARGQTKGQSGDDDSKIEDYTTVIEMEDAPADFRVFALINRGVIKAKDGDRKGAINDYTAAIDVQDAHADLCAQAFNNRGDIKSQDGDSNGAIDDYTAVIEMQDAPADHRAYALKNRGSIKGQYGENDEAIGDFTTIIEMGDAPIDHRSQAFFFRGLSMFQAGFNKEAIDDFTTVIEMKDAAADLRINALSARGFTKGQIGDSGGAIEDLTAVIEMKDASADQRAHAFNNRGEIKGQAGDYGGVSTIIRLWLKYKTYQPINALKPLTPAAAPSP